MTYFLDLFAGIGGFALGAQWAGLHFDGHYFSEVDDYASRVYRLRFPDAVALGDIRGIAAASLPVGDWILAGGFPCQDISVAGKGAGLAGERSGLWYEYARLIGELRPRYAIMENVGALAFRGLDSVLGSLAEIGYDAEWQDIRASDVGAPHRRERLWIVAYRQDEGAAWRERIEGDGSSDGRGGDNRGSGSGCDARGEDVPHSDDHRLREPFQPICERGSGLEADARGDATQLGCGQGREGRPDSGSAGKAEQALCDPPSQGFSDGPERAIREPGKVEESERSNWWAAEPDVGRVAHGIPSRVDRLKCLGNSIVPQIAELIFSATAFDEWRTPVANIPEKR